jgi:DNA-directed RNA polymerase beta subunit
MPLKERYQQTLPKECNAELAKLVAPHINSFDFFLGEGMKEAIKDVDRIEINTETFRCTYWLEDIVWVKPRHLSSTLDDALYPSEAIKSGY